MRKKRALKIIAALAALPLLYVLFFAAPYFKNALFHNNFNVVVPERFYRSAEMPRQELGELIDERGIKSVIDLRLSGGEPDESGISEGQLAAAHGAQYRHLPFTSSKTTQRERVLRLLDAFDEMPTPILVHCTSGSERSGFASVVWLIEHEHRPVPEAMKQLDLRYGYNRLERNLRSWLSRPTLDRVLLEYAKVRETREVGFREWARDAPILEAPAK